MKKVYISLNLNHTDIILPQMWSNIIQTLTHDWIFIIFNSIKHVNMYRSILRIIEINITTHELLKQQ